MYDIESPYVTILSSVSLYAIIDNYLTMNNYPLSLYTIISFIILPTSDPLRWGSNGIGVYPMEWMYDHEYQSDRSLKENKW